MKATVTKIAALIGLAAASLDVSAQESQDTTYVHRFKKQITTRVFLGEKIASFSLVDHKNDRDLRYRPNNILGIGIGTTIKGIGLNFSTRLPFHDTKESLYGKTRRYDFQAHRYRDKWMFDFYGQRYKGFHLNSTDVVDSVVGPQTYPYLPDLTALTLGLSGLYVFNGDKFSMKGAINQQDWQLRSAGSFMVGAAFFARYVYNNGSILPPYFRYPDFYDGMQLQHISNYGLTLRVGYGYNYVYRKNYFIGGTADIGAGPSYSLVRDTQGGEQTGFGTNFSLNARVGMGYNDQKWFGGLYAIYHTDQYSLPSTTTRLWTNQGIFRIVVARRFAYNKLF